PGAGCEAFFATAQARAVAYGFINCLESEGTQGFRLDFDPGLAAKIIQHLDRFLISEQVELADCTAEIAQFHVAGPEAEAVVKKATRRTELPAVELEELTDSSVQIRRHSLLALPGYDLS